MGDSVILAPSMRSLIRIASETSTIPISVTMSVSAPGVTTSFGEQDASGLQRGARRATRPRPRARAIPDRGARARARRSAGRSWCDEAEQHRERAASARSIATACSSLLTAANVVRRVACKADPAVRWRSSRRHRRRRGTDRIACPRHADARRRRSRLRPQDRRHDHAEARVPATRGSFKTRGAYNRVCRTRCRLQA